MSPHVRAVCADVDGHVADDGNATAVGISAQLLPLAFEQELAAPVLLGISAQLVMFRHAVRIETAVFFRPFLPRRSRTDLAADRHEASIWLEPVRLALAELAVLVAFVQSGQVIGVDGPAAFEQARVARERADARIGAPAFIGGIDGKHLPIAHTRLGEPIHEGARRRTQGAPAALFFHRKAGYVGQHAQTGLHRLRQALMSMEMKYERRDRVQAHEGELARIGEQLSRLPGLRGVDNLDAIACHELGHLVCDHGNVNVVDGLGRGVDQHAQHAAALPFAPQAEHLVVSGEPCASVIVKRCERARHIRQRCRRARCGVAKVPGSGRAARAHRVVLAKRRDDLGKVVARAVVVQIAANGLVPCGRGFFGTVHGQPEAGRLPPDQLAFSAVAAVLGAVAPFAVLDVDDDELVPHDALVFGHEHDPVARTRIGRGIGGRLVRFHLVTLLAILVGPRAQVRDRPRGVPYVERERDSLTCLHGAERRPVLGVSRIM